VRRVQAIPGVQNVGLANIILNAGSSAGSDVTALEPGAETKNALFDVVDTGYKDALLINLVAGRWFDARDTRGSQRVAVINQEFARRVWGEGNVVGKHFRRGDDDVEVIGIARDGKYSFLGEKPQIFSYFAFAQYYNARMSLHVRTNAEPAETLNQIREVVRSLDANVALERANTLDVVAGMTLLPQRLGASLIGAFGVLGLLLASLGVYGVLAFQVAQRSREIGIRLALGATVRGVLGLVLRQGARLALIGSLAGIAFALAATRYLQSFLFGVSPLDPLTFLGVPLVLMLVALAASYIPARRAARVTPLEALRSE
jgi:predicted permease